jgi:hypothetical protein
METNVIRALCDAADALKRASDLTRFGDVDDVCVEASRAVKHALALAVGEHDFEIGGDDEADE